MDYLDAYAKHFNYKKISHDGEAYFKSLSNGRFCTMQREKNSKYVTITCNNKSDIYKCSDLALCIIENFDICEI